MSYIISKWDKRFFEHAEHISTWSKDKNRQVGCVVSNEDNIIMSIGYNGFPRGTNDDDFPERYERPLKYIWSEHAEKNAIYNAAREGTKLKDCNLYCTYFPCVDCCKAIIQVGINKIFAPKPDFTHETYGDSWKVGVEMLNECGIKIIYI
tara:strand:+ start:194985 stop:195434 length:450 start_codon:yes stop_codon:yes gene_type:complete